jgi:hypothetical protein
MFIELRLLTLVTLNIKNMAESPRVYAFPRLVLLSLAVLYLLSRKSRQG